MEQLVINLDRRLGRRIVKIQILVSVSLALIGLAAAVSFIHDMPGSRFAIAVLGVDEESSIPTWWSAIVLALLGILTAVVGTRRAGDRIDLLAWWAISIGFVLLSIDEIAMLHERVGYFLDVSGRFHDARWIIIWLPLAAAAASLAAYRLWRTSRQFILGLILGAVVFLSGAVGVELLNASIRHEYRSQAQVEGSLTTPERGEASADRQESAGSSIERHADDANYAYAVGTAIEELLEMLGAAVWMAAVFRAGTTGRVDRPKPSTP